MEEQINLLLDFIHWRYHRENEVVNTGTIISGDVDQQCTDDIDEFSSQMEEWPIRISTAKA